MHAQMAKANDRSVTEGSMKSSSGIRLPLEHTAVTARVIGIVAEVEVKQVFRNHTAEPIEATYSFPLPHAASVHRMCFRIRDRIVRATVKEKEDAKRIYQKARREGRSATLLEQDDPSVFTLSVANVPAGESIEVELAYQECVTFDEGEFRFVFPMVTTDRHAASAPTTNGGARVTPAGAGVRPPLPPIRTRRPDISLVVSLDAGEPIDAPRSPTHQINVTPNSTEDRYDVSLAANDSIANRDFVLVYRSRRRGIAPRVFFERAPSRPGTFLLQITPAAQAIEAGPKPTAGRANIATCDNCGGGLADPATIQTVEGFGSAWKCEYCGVLNPIRHGRNAPRVNLPRDVVFMVDRSCSMRGRSLEQAGRAVAAMLDTLGPEDAFQLFAFDHERVAFDGHGDSWQPITRATIQQALAFLQGLGPRGGTELEEALVRASKLPANEHRTRLFVLLTDASIGNEGRLLRRLPEILGATNDPGRARLYVLGLGPAVHRYLIDRLARLGGGASDVVLPDDDAEAQIAKFARRVRHAGPVLTNIQVTWEDAMPADVYPHPLPDLFAGQSLHVLGRYVGEGPSVLCLSGQLADGRPFRQEVPVTLPASSPQVPGLERLWARLRIDSRLSRLIDAPNEAGDVRHEVLALALRHSLVSPYTALVAEDSEPHAAGQHARRIEQHATIEPGLELEGHVAPLLFGSTGAGSSAPPPGSSAPPMPMACAAPARYSADAEAAGADEYAAPRRPAPATAAVGSTAVTPRARSVTAGVPPSELSGRSGGSGASKRADLAAPAPSRKAPSAPPKTPFDAPEDESLAADVGMPVPTLPPGAPPGPFGRTKSKRSFLGGIIDSLFGRQPTSSEDLEESALDDRCPSPAVTNSLESLSERNPAPASDAYSEAEVAWAWQRGVGALDLVFLIDETGSMGAYIAQVKERLLELVRALERAPLCRSIRIGLISYRDHPPQDRTYASRAIALTSDIAAIRQAVSELHASGGGDGPEALTDGLFDLVRLDFRDHSTRLAILVGDAPPHGVEPEGDGFPAGCPCGQHWFTQAESCREMGIVIHAVGCLPALQKYVGGVEVFKTVAHTTRGVYLPLEKSELLVPLVLSMAESELDKQRVIEHVADAIAQHESLLCEAEEQEQQRFVREYLTQQGVRARRAEYDPHAGQAPPCVFRSLTSADIEESVAELRRLGRIQM